MKTLSPLVLLPLLLLLACPVLFPTASAFSPSLEEQPEFHGRKWQKDGFCSEREGEKCCPGRNDECTVPFFDTLCYCDIFCNRTLSDCCPDFLAVCLGIEPSALKRTERPPEDIKNNCFHEGRLHEIGDRIDVNCNNCTCVHAVIREEYNWKCTQKTCLVRQELIDYVNANATKLGWSASNYSVFWGMTLDEGVKRRLGTHRPSTHVTQMNVIKAVPSKRPPPTEFDARREWPGLISPVLDQKDCAASWAFSTAGVASDRLRIHSNGLYNQTLSPQHLVSCNTDHGQHGCGSGHVDRAWWFIRKTGIVTNDCFHYTSGSTKKAVPCPLPRSLLALKRSKCPQENVLLKVYQVTPPYRISLKEEEIMKEIMENGPLQAVMEVKEDFYVYRSGVYRHSLPADYLPPHQRRTSFHSVRLIGWGVDSSSGHPLKYWLCANSWGPEWGEAGHFRILRGTDESSIESYIVGTWIKVDDRTLVHRRPSQHGHDDEANDHHQQPRRK